MSSSRCSSGDAANTDSQIRGAHWPGSRPCDRRGGTTRGTTDRASARVRSPPAAGRRPHLPGCDGSGPDGGSTILRGLSITSGWCSTSFTRQSGLRAANREPTPKPSHAKTTGFCACDATTHRVEVVGPLIEDRPLVVGRRVGEADAAPIEEHDPADLAETLRAAGRYPGSPRGTPSGTRRPTPPRCRARRRVAARVEDRVRDVRAVRGPGVLDLRHAATLFGFGGDLVGVAPGQRTAR